MDLKRLQNQADHATEKLFRYMVNKGMTKCLALKKNNNKITFPVWRDRNHCHGHRKAETALISLCLFSAHFARLH